MILKLENTKSPISIDNIDFKEIAVSNKVSFGKKDFKYFIGYKDTKNMWSSCLFLRKISAYRRDFDKTKCMLFLIKDGNCLKNPMKFRNKSVTLSKKIWQ